MGVAERRAREKEALRSKILDAASQLFVEEGVPSVSVRKIADRIEYSPATIYLYFRDKNDLLASLCRETFNGLKEELLRLEQEETDQLRQLRRGLRFYIDFGLEHPHHYILTFGTPHGTYDMEKAPEFLEANKVGLETFDCLRRSLERCRATGLLRFDDLEATAQVVWTFIHGTTSLLILYHSDPHFPWVTKEQLIETGLDMILKSLQ
jgi:AcrR family transcriptional regulator